MKVTKQCKIRFVISVDFINEVDLDVVPLDVCGVMFGSPYMYMHDAIFKRRANQYQLIKDGKSFIINAHKVKSKFSLISANQAKKLISSSKKYVLLFLRESQSEVESIRGKASLEGCTMKQKQQWRSYYRHTRMCLESLKDYHLREKWSMRSSYCQTPHCQILGCTSNLL